MIGFFSAIISLLIVLGSINKMKEHLKDDIDEKSLKRIIPNQNDIKIVFIFLGKISNTTDIKLKSQYRWTLMLFLIGFLCFIFSIYYNIKSF
ncbi:hypothetical protein ACE01N_07910 [Saccharicrinis sp. FJH2]|uniref:hypothetical protein n=1 Tax=Saccharicrinis sp. FJH65 TaxID=3344659 RepID=UPI0035F3B8C8